MLLKEEKAFTIYHWSPQEDRDAVVQQSFFLRCGVLISMICISPYASGLSLYQKIPAFHAYIWGDPTGNVSEEFQSQSNVIPASSLKAITALLAYNVLGSDFRYTTSVSVSMEGETLNDVILMGSGDPTFTSMDLENLLKPLQGKTVKRAFYVDLSAYQLPFYSNNIMRYDLGSFDCRPLSTFNIDGNLVNIKVAHVDGEVQISNDFSIPFHSSIVLDEGLTHITSIWNDEGIKLSGVLHKGDVFFHPVAPANMQAYIEHKVQRVLKKLNIQASVVVVQDLLKIPHERTEISIHHSAPLDSILPPALKCSDNFVFDAFYLTLIHQDKKTTPQDWHEGDPIIKAMIKKHFQLEMPYALIVDGSGISRHNQVSVRVFYELLCKGATHEAFVKAFPRAGEVNTSLENRNLSPHIRAKTGFLLGVVALCGYGLDKDGKPSKVFVVVSNNTSGPAVAVRKAHEEFLKECLPE